MRTTTTNSGADSKGVVRLGRWELEGDSYLLLVVGAVFGVAVFILCYRSSFWLRAGASLVPLAAALFWIRFFVCGRPPHFVGDFFEGLVAGVDFRVRMNRRPRPVHPRHCIQD
jgi:hypothetical protein